MDDINFRIKDIENIFIILTAIEDNLVEYLRMKNEIIEVKYLFTNSCK